MIGSEIERFEDEIAIVAIQAPETANARQHGGDHYKNMPIQTWDYIIGNNIGWLEGNIIKYVSRWNRKGQVEDLHKAQHYLQKLIEVASART